MSLFFQGRGDGQGAGSLAERDATGIIGSALLFCPDSVSIALNTDSFEHINKCGPVDVPDYRGIKSVGAELTLSWVDAQDKMFAVATLGTVIAGAPGTVVGEQLPTSIPAGFVWYLGNLTPHRAITGLTISGATLTTDYTVDAASGAVTFVTDQSSSPGPTAGYSYTDPGSVSLLSAAQKSYFFRFAFINKADANNPGVLELYNVRFDPASLVDFMSDELQTFELKGTVLADTSKLVTDTEFGQFGRRVL